MLIPMYLIIGVWGGPRRVYAAVKFILYTLAGSLLMLVAILALYFQYGAATGTYTFDLPVLAQFVLPAGRAQTLMFLAFALAFAIKVPMFPFHTWLPDAHTEAPTAGSVILAGVLLKMGTYGFLRFCLPLFPHASLTYAPWIFALAVIGIIYGAWCATVQPDIKKLVAYSSVSHLGFVMLGIFTLTPEGLVGGIIQMINHGLSTSALFLIVGMIYERRHTRLISEFGGLWKVMPAFSVLFLVVCLSSLGLPGLNGFIGEFLVLLGAFQVDWRLAAFATTGIIFAAFYLLWMYQRVIFGEITVEANRRLKDLSLREWAVILPVLLFIVWIGVYPITFTRTTEASVRSPHHAGADQGGGDHRPGGGPMSEIVFPAIDMRAIGPLVALAVTGLVLLVLDILPPRHRKDHLALIGIAGVVVSLIMTLWMWGSEVRAFRGMVILDSYALFFNLIIGYATGIVLLLSIDYVRRLSIETGEFYILVIFAAVGMMLMATAGDLIVVFLGLETMSISLYVLAGFFRDRIEAGEASMKYFLLGAFASGFFLYGIALVFGATGSTNLDKIANAVAGGAARDPMLLIGFGLLLVGFGFKISAGPFSLWAPDVYEGAPTSVTAFIATGSKAAAFAALLRVLLTSFRVPRSTGRRWSGGSPSSA